MTDITIVLKQIFESNILSNRKEKVDNITFQYTIENKRKYSINYISIIRNIILDFATISLTIIILNFCFDINQVVNFDNVEDQIDNFDYVNDQSLN
jgi:hypothetical protein